MADWIPICAADKLIEGGKGMRFLLTAGGEDAGGFVVRFEGVVRAYLNRCAHVPVELDWEQGEFFDSSGLYLMCSIHGAVYLPESGKCAGGPCKGGRLRPISVMEEAGTVYWQTDDYFTPVRA